PPQTRQSTLPCQPFRDLLRVESGELTAFMKRATIIMAAYLLLMLSAVLPVQQTRAPGPLPVSMVIAPAPPDEVRALWVVRATLASPASIKEMVSRARAAGFRTLIVQVRGRGDAYYASRWEPRAAEL